MSINQKRRTAKACGTKHTKHLIEKNYIFSGQNTSLVLNLIGIGFGLGMMIMILLK